MGEQCNECHKPLPESDVAYNFISHTVVKRDNKPVLREPILTDHWLCDDCWRELLFDDS